MKLSIIFGARNDDYGNIADNEISYLEKMGYCLRSIHKSLEGIDYEIIIMDINPVEGKKLVYDHFHHPRVKSFVFPKKKLLWYIERHFQAGAKFILDDVELTLQEVISFAKEIAEKCEEFFEIKFDPELEVEHILTVLMPNIYASRVLKNVTVEEFFAFFLKMGGY